MPFALINRMCELKSREADESRGVQSWEPDSIPEPVDPDGPPDKSLFIAYAGALGKSKEWAEKEYERQIKNGGYGKVVGRDGKPY